jgi:Right handed beta helix region
MSRSLRRPSRPRPTFRPRLECLESRTVLSTFTVANLNDSGSGSLRQAILDANGHGGANTIAFASGVTGAIVLASSLPDLSTNIDLEGPGSANLTVQFASVGIPPASNIFHVVSGATGTVAGLTILAASNDGILNDDGTLTVNECTFTNCQTYGVGSYGAENLTVNDCSFNTSEQAGVNIAASASGAAGAVSVSDCTFFDNVAGVSQDAGTATVSGCTFTDNGTGVSLGAGTMTVSASSFSGNGAGISNDGALTVDDCTIQSTNGNGVSNAGTATIDYSTIADNVAGNGGGVYNTGTLSITNSTVAGNRADGAFAEYPVGKNEYIYEPTAPAVGGGIWNSGTLTVASCTIASNTAVQLIGPDIGSNGGGIASTGGTVTVQNTIIAQNQAPADPDVSGSFVSNGCNLIGAGAGSSGFTAPGDQVGSAAAPINPLLGPLQNNGGSTATMALLPYSPAIDAGSNAAATGLTTDQRGPGFSRFVGPVDIGAFEVQPVTQTLTGISPTSATAGDSATTITLTGSSFVNSSTADFNGAAIATTFVSATQLTAVIPASDLTTAGAESITVVTAGPGGGTSAAQTFTVNVAPPPPPPSQQSLPPFVSVAFGPLGEVIELVNSAGVLTQFDGAGAHQLGNGGVRSASIAFGPNGYVLEVVSTAGILTQFDATGAHQLGGAGVESASVAFGPGGPVLEVVLVDGSLRQFSAAGVQLLASSGVISASVAFGPGGEVVDMVSTAGFLTQYDAAGVHPFGGAGVQSAGVAFFANNEVLDIIFSDGTLDQFDVFGVHRLGMVP